MGTLIKHPVPDRVKPSFVIIDIRALWRFCTHTWHFACLYLYSAGAGSPEKLATLEAELQQAENQLRMTSSEHRELTDVVENIKRNQQQQVASKSMVRLYSANCWLC